MFLTAQAARQGFAYGLRHPLHHRALFLHQFHSLRPEVPEDPVSHEFYVLLHLRVELLQHLDDHRVCIFICHGDKALHAVQLGLTFCKGGLEYSQLLFICRPG